MRNEVLGGEDVDASQVFFFFPFKYFLLFFFFVPTPSFPFRLRDIKEGGEGAIQPPSKLEKKKICDTKRRAAEDKELVAGRGNVHKTGRIT